MAKQRKASLIKLAQDMDLRNRHGVRYKDSAQIQASVRTKIKIRQIMRDLFDGKITDEELFGDEA